MKDIKELNENELEPDKKLKERERESESDKKTRQKEINRLTELFLRDYPAKSRFAEAYRTLRTNVHFSFMNKEFRSLMITSAGAKEGKTNTVANIGYTLSQSGKSVLMIDADLRKPMLTTLTPSQGSRGLTGLLSDIFDLNAGDIAVNGEEKIPCLDEKIGSDILNIPINNSDNPDAPSKLFLLPSGRRPPNPHEILGSKGMSFLVSYLTKKFDVVVIDTPPLLPASDALLLAPQTDGVLLIVKAGMINRSLVRKAVDQLRMSKANLLGVVLNSMDSRKEGYYYYYNKKYYSKYYSGYYGKYK